MRLAGFAVGLFLLAATPAFASNDIDQATKRYLTGNWAVLTTDHAKGNACADPQVRSDSWEEYEITFDRDGGSFYVIDETDADFRLRIVSATKSGNVIQLTLSNRARDKITAVPVDRDRMRILSAWGPDAAKVKLVAFRCPRHHLPG